MPFATLFSSARMIAFSALTLGAVPALAQSMPYTASDQNAAPTNMPQQDNPGQNAHSEHYTAHGKHSLPPGYQDAPSNDISHGPDPDHLSNLQRDPVTGANLGKFGSAYTNSSPTQQGQLGDATGNGWVAPR